MPLPPTRLWIAGVVALAGGPLAAHTVPTLTVEAEFSSGRTAVFRVNLDPRLFLSPQPTTLPPVPSSWWLEQDEAARARTSAETTAFLRRILRFEVGGTPLAADWRVDAIDSASAFPLTANSAETHLLAEHRGPLPPVAGDFTVTLAHDSAVGMILLNSFEGKPERHPQALFPGESSRAFKLPAPAAPQVAEAADAGSWHRTVRARLMRVVPGWGGGSRHFAGDHLLLAVVLALVLGARWPVGAWMLGVFQAAHGAAAWAAVSGWLPEAHRWMQAAGWAALAGGLFGAHQQRTVAAMICFGSAGLAHGLHLPHLHLPADSAGPGWGILRDAVLLLAWQAAVLAAAGVVRGRWERRRGPGLQSC